MFQAPIRNGMPLTVLAEILSVDTNSSATSKCNASFVTSDKQFLKVQIHEPFGRIISSSITVAMREFGR